MATYDDFKTITEETLRVDSRNRITPQKVKFVNKNNKFYGSFYGDFTSDSAKFNNVELSNATLYDKNGNIQDLNKIFKMGERLDDLELSVTDTFPSLVDEKIKDSQSVVSDRIDKLGERVDDLYKNMQEGDDNLHDEVVNVSSDIKEMIDDLDKNLNISVDTIVSIISEEEKNRINAVEELSVELKKDISILNTELNDRDEKLNKRIDTEVKTLEQKIENEKHYSIVSDINLNDSKIKIKDFAINVIKNAVVSNALLYHNGYVIGKIQNTKENTETGKIDVLEIIIDNDISDPELLDCFPPSQQIYTFDPDHLSRPTFNGWNINVEPSEDLPTCKITVSYSSKQVMKIRDHLNRDIGIIRDYVINDDILKSGTIELLPGSKSDLSSVNGFSGYFEGNKKFTYIAEGDLLNNEIVINPESKTGYINCHCVYDKLTLLNTLDDNKNFGFIKNGDITSDKIKVNLDTIGFTGVYDVKLTDGYETELDKDYTLRFLTTESCVAIRKNQIPYEYHLSAITKKPEKPEDVIERDAYMTTNHYNEPLDSSSDFSEVYFKHDIEGFESEITLKKVDGFKKTLTNASGDRLTIVLDKENTHIKCIVDDHTGETRFTFFRYDFEKYEIKRNEGSNVIKSQSIDIETPKYDDPTCEYSTNFTISDPHLIEKPSKTFNVVENTSKSIKLDIPVPELGNEYSKEFIVVFENIKADSDWVNIEIDPSIKLMFNGILDSEIYVKSGEGRVSYLFRQVEWNGEYPTYEVRELDDKLDKHFIEDLKKKLEDEITERTEINEEHDRQIEDIYSKLSGIVNYKGIINLSGNYAPVGVRTGLRLLFQDNGYSDDFGLSAGWYFRVKSSEEYHDVDGLKIGDRDYLKIEDYTYVSGISSSNVLVVDTLDKDTAHYKDLVKLSTDLNTKITTNKDTIDAVSSYVNDHFFQKDSEEKQVVTTNVSIVGDVEMGNLTGTGSFELQDGKVHNLEVTGVLKAKETKTKVEVTDLEAENGVISNLSVDISALTFKDIGKTAKEMNEAIELSVSNNSSNVSELSGDYHKFYDGTFKYTEIDKDPTCKLSVDNLIVVDEDPTGEGHRTHDKYRMTFKRGTLVMEKI